MHRAAARVAAGPHAAQQQPGAARGDPDPPGRAEQCFSAALSARTATTPGTFGFLLGDAANALHFWPGRGLNSGLAGAVSLARCLASRWSGTGFRDADFTRHEAMMAMLQYRHKTRAWRQMTTTDEAGATVAIKDLIARGIEEGRTTSTDRGTDLDTLMERLRQIRSRLAARLDGLPDDARLRAHLERLDDRTLHTLVVSEPWDSAGVGGEEVDVDLLLAEADTPLPAGTGTAGRTGHVGPRTRAGSPVPAA